MPTPDIARVRGRLQAGLANLLDMSLRNRLLNYRTPRVRGLDLIGESPAEVYRLLVTEGRTFTFAPAPERSNADRLAQRYAPPAVPTPADTVPAPPDAPGAPPANPTLEVSAPGGRAATTETESAAADTVLQTAETPASLAHRLQRIHRDAKASLEDQGVNVLFVALGMLEWFESDSSPDPHRAPLVLVPVSLERGRGRTYRLHYDETEVGGNPCLAAKLRQDFGLRLPEFGVPESVEVTSYFDEVRKAVAGQARWRVDDRAVALGFFSYAKHLMVRDLEGEDWPDEAKPWMHPILGSLLDCGFEEAGSAPSEEEHLDAFQTPEDMGEVRDADSSQVLALLTARHGASMVIEGPPGTGKSQTITNLIAQSLARRLKVLFVAEKRAALDVVWRNLEKAGLHEACLELHSNKANKREFYTRLKAAVELGRPSLRPCEREREAYTAARDRLNAYAAAMNDPVPPYGLTPYAALGRLLELGDAREDEPAFEFAAMRDWTGPEFAQRLETARCLQTKVAQIGSPAANPFFGSRRTQVLPDDKLEWSARLRSARDALDQARTTAGVLADRLGLPLPENLEQARAAGRAAAKLLDAPDLSGLDVAAETWLESDSALAEMLAAGARLRQCLDSFQTRLKPEAWTADLAEVRTQIVRAGEHWWRFLSGSYRRSLAILRGLCAGDLPRTLAERLALTDAILDVQAARRKLSAAENLLRRHFGSAWTGETSDWAALDRARLWTADLHRQVAEQRLPASLVPVAAARPERQALAAAAEHAATAAAALEKALDSLLVFLDGRESWRGLPSQSFTHVREILDKWQAALPRLLDLASFNVLADEAAAQGLSWLAEAAASWEGAGERLTACLERAWHLGVLRAAFEARPELKRFDRQAHEETVREFRRLDQFWLGFNRARLARQHWDGVPRHAAGGRLGLLLAEFEKKVRHKPIRRMLEEAGEAVQAIKPVFMMSPLSVAMYLAPRGPRFDLVIFDEASQVKPEDAFGPILRARQAIVVGDSRQMPPTSFFDKLTQLEDENPADPDNQPPPEPNLTRDFESILALMSARLPPGSALRRDLRWHYRSRHDSLIAVSNRLFYRDRLIVFPTADRRRRDLGLVFHHQAAAAYGRGSSQKNIPEAEAVAAAVVRHLRERPELSLGVAAFSVAQQDALEEALERLGPSTEEAAAFDARHPTEPFFIKNLENVQGDERDVIFISVGYGRDVEGRLTLSFGPLNQEGGERRLNVLITRARARCEVFSNLRASDLPASGVPAGVAALREFLLFAETGRLAEDASAGATASATPFEADIVRVLAEAGYQAALGVGAPGCQVAVAVRDPREPDRFVLAVELDGPGYAAARTARDRERTRPDVLEHRGWRLHRVWSLNWVLDRERERQRLLEAVEAALSDAGSSSNPPTLPAADPVSRENPVPADPAGNEYRFARLSIKLGRRSLAEVEPVRMAGWVGQVVDIESPVAVEEVVRRIREAAGAARLTDAVREAVQRGVDLAVASGRVSRDGAFLLAVPPRPPVPRHRAGPAAALRDPGLIHPAEIQAALRDAIRESFGVARAEAAAAALRRLGFERVTESAREPVERLVADWIRAGVLVDRGGFLHTPA
jgi:hypothetical protein